MSDIRVRFAPSPTGQVHIGNIRAAIFNWLYARHVGGKFLLRVEDTDLERSTPEAIRALLDVMQWLHLDYDEPEVYQTHNVKRHLECAEQLVRDGFAYRAEKPTKDGKTGEVVIFRMPKEGVLAYDDLVKGHMEKKAADTQDFVIVRSDGSPVFHLANVVDDIDQGITHVIRGDDHVENTFKHLELFKALGVTPPKYGHLPMIVNAQGKPYSKRDGAAFVGEFREQGYLPEALFNYLLLLGWNPGDDREVLSRDEMVSLFTLEACHSSPAKFDIKKLQWMNGEYVRRLPRETFKEECTSRIAAGGVDLAAFAAANPSFDWNLFLDQMQVRTKFLNDVPGNCLYFFRDDYEFDQKAVEKRLAKPGTKDLLLDLAARFEKLEPFTVQAGEEMVKGLAQGQGMGPWVHPIRVAVSGRQDGPGLFEMLVLLGREKTVKRLRDAAEKYAL